jgi:putative transposase
VVDTSLPFSATVMCNALALVGAKQRQMVAAAIRAVFTQETEKAAHTEWRDVAKRLRARFPKLAELMDETEDDVLAHELPQGTLGAAALHQPPGTLNGEITPRTDVVAIFPNGPAIVRLIGALLLEQNDRMGGAAPLHELGNPRRSER